MFRGGFLGGGWRRTARDEWSQSSRLDFIHFVSYSFVCREKEINRDIIAINHHLAAVRVLRGLNIIKWINCICWEGLTHLLNADVGIPRAQTADSFGIFEMIFPRSRQ